MKYGSFIGTAMASLVMLGSSCAQSNSGGAVCFGANCNGGEPDWNFYAPGNAAFDQAWMDYGTWRGITARFHIDESSVQACLTHCEWHASEADSVCRANNPLNGVGVCNDTYQEVYNKCAVRCTEIAH